MTTTDGPTLGGTSGYELCIGTDQPGGGVVFDAVVDAKSAGWERVGPLDDREAATVPSEAFFTIHELGADGASPIVVFDSRNEYADG